MRTCSKRHQFAQVDGNDFIINGIWISLLFCPNFASTLCFEELLGNFIRRENRSGCTQFCTHIGDGCTFRNGKGLDAFATVFDNFSNAALYREPLQNFQNNILCSNPRGQLTSQFYLYNLRAGNIISTAAHCNCNVQTACTHCNHTDTAASRGMAVRTNQGFTWHAEPFQMYLMANTIARTGEINTVLLGNAADKAVVVCIFKTTLQSVVVNIGNAAFCPYSWNAHCFKFQICHCTGSILCQGLVDTDSDFGTLFHFAFYQMCLQDFFG